MTDGLWHSKRKKKRVSHPIRERRPRIGELVQIDCSPHDWFEGKVTVLYNSKDQLYETYKRGEKPQPVANEKTINQTVNQAIINQKPKRKLKVNYPWRKLFQSVTKKRTLLFRENRTFLLCVDSSDIFHVMLLGQNS